MCKILRKVRFSLGNYVFDPDATPEEMAESDDISKIRIGYFHRWVDDVDTSKDIPFIKTMALVEDIENGQVYMVEYHNVVFY